MKIYVSVVDASGKKLTFPLREKPIVIGRSSKAHVTITDELASGTHCLIYYKDKCVFVEDNQSKNGIFLNGIKVFKQRIYLEDKIRIGGSFLYFEINKLDEPCKKLLTPKGDGNRAAGEMTLELDKTQKNYVRKNKKLDDKLYEGVNDSNKKLKKKKVNTKILFIREQLANIIDLILTLAALVLPTLAYKYLYEEEFKKLFFKDGKFDIVSITNQTTLYIIAASLVLSLLFYYYNRKKGSRSLGEFLLGLN